MSRQTTYKKGSFRKALNKVQAQERLAKTYKGDWYTINSIFGNDWAMFYILLGGREAGKSYSVMKWACNRKLKLGENMKFYWLRLTDKATDKLLNDSADKFIDPDIKRKLGLKVGRKGSKIFTYREVEAKDGRKLKRDKKDFAEVLSCSTFYNTKGVGYFDNEFKGEYLLVLDEMNREESERNLFDIVYNFTNLIENIARSTKEKIRIVMIGNTLEEASDLLTAFNFIPDKYGRYKLKSKRAVVDYIRPSEAYLKRREGTAANILTPNASTFTNEIQIDRSLLVNKRTLTSPKNIIKFGKSVDKWFALYYNNIVTSYKGEQKPVISMRRYLDEVYMAEAANAVVELFDNRQFRFTEISTFKRFQKELRLIKRN